MGRVTVQDGRLFAYASEFPMDIMTSVGLVSGIIVVSVMVLMGGDLHMFISEHAIIIIFGGSIAATMIRFRLSAILHGLPLGAKFAFTMSRLSARDLVDELARIAEIARKQGPVGLEKVETDEPFLAKGIRYVAGGYDLEFIRDNLERDRDNFLMHLDEGGKIYRAIGDCAPAFGMIGTLIGMVQMFANMTDPRSWSFLATAWRRFTGRWSRTCSVCRSRTSCMASCSTRKPIAR
jgi:chemotaxis protein MotA